MHIQSSVGLLPSSLLSTATQMLTAAGRAMVTLRDRFAAGGHQPSAQQWAAILDLLDHLEASANRDVANAVYVSAIPAGTGKSASIAAFAKALIETPGYELAGMLILCNRVSEVQDMAEVLQPQRSSLCVIVGKAWSKVADLGDHETADGAQIVISTQAALKESLRQTRWFDTATRYHYHGRRRDVVAWDEAIAFNRPVVLGALAVAGLAEAMGAQSDAAALRLIAWAAEMAGGQGGQCEVPDFEGLGVDFRRLETAVTDRDELVAQAKALSVISGGMGWVLRDNPQSAAMVTYHPELPESLMPLVVTDASAAHGVHRVHYNQMAATRPVRWLKEAEKTYHNLTLRIVDTAASRSTYKDKSTKGRDLIEMAV